MTTSSIAGAFGRVLGRPLRSPVDGLRRQQLRIRRRRRDPVDPLTRGRAVPGDRSGRPRPGTRVRQRLPRRRGRACTGALTLLGRGRRPGRLDARQAGTLRELGTWVLKRPPLPPEEASPPWRRGLRHSKERDAKAIAHHYDVSQPRSTSWCWAVDDLHLRGLPGRRRHRSRRPRRPSTTWSLASSRSSRACDCSTSAAAGVAWSCTRPRSTA